MKILFLFTNTALDWSAMGQGSLAAMVITAVFVIIVQPLTKQIIRSNDKLADAVTALNQTISNGDKHISDAMKDVEHRIIERFATTIEGSVIARESLNEMKETLARIEGKLDK